MPQNCGLPLPLLVNEADIFYSYGDPVATTSSSYATSKH